ncbi:DASH complex subunit Dad3 [Trichoderma camerunense]
MEQQQHGSLLSPPELSPLEQEVLEEYERLSTNMKTLATLLDTLASNPTVGILDGLRELERKTSLAFTLLKASVYSIVLQQEIDWGAGGEEEQGGEEAKEEETKVEEDDDEEEERL